MADNVYVINTLAPTGPTVTLVDTSGIDTLKFIGTFPKRATINLQWTTDDNFQPTSASGIYFPNSNNNDAGRLTIEGIIENAYGSDSQDDITGNSLANILFGDNARSGVGGDDVIVAGGGADTVYGGEGRDTISGNEGSDRLYGDAGADQINGNDGIDRIEGGAGGDTLSGGGDLGDTASYASSSARVVIKITYGSQTTGAGGDAAYDKIDGFTDVLGSAYNDLITDTVKGNLAFDYNKSRFDGGAGNDVLTLGGGNDTGLGGIGNDQLFGEDGADRLYGQDGIDKLTGGLGKDQLTGGAAADTFIYTSVDDSTRTVYDTILDFQRSDRDKIDLRQIDANGTGAGDTAFAFIGTSSFSGVAGQLRYASSGGDTVIIGDTNGDRQADLYIRIDGAVALLATDFLL